MIAKYFYQNSMIAKYERTGTLCRLRSCSNEKSNRVFGKRI